MFKKMARIICMVVVAIVIGFCLNACVDIDEALPHYNPVSQQK